MVLCQKVFHAKASLHYYYGSLGDEKGPQSNLMHIFFQYLTYLVYLLFESITNLRPNISDISF